MYQFEKCLSIDNGQTLFKLECEHNPETGDTYEGQNDDTTGQESQKNRHEGVDRVIDKFRDEPQEVLAQKVGESFWNETPMVTHSKLTVEITSKSS